MRIQPVRRRRTARYPTRQTLSERPDLLKSMPQRWQSSRVVITLVGSVSMLAAARSMQKESKEEYVTLGAPAFPPGYVQSIEIQNAFEREAKKAGLHLVKQGRNVPVKVKIGSTTQTKLKPIDEIDPKTGIGFEFVDAMDCVKVYGWDSGKGPADLAKAIKEGLKHVKNGERIKVMDATAVDSDKQVSKAKREIKSFFQWLKKQGVI